MNYLQSFLFGLTIALSIGPIAILILNQSINCGLKNGVLCGLGAALADFTYAFIALTIGAVIFPFLENQKEIIPIISSIILILFGIWMVSSTLKKGPGNSNDDNVLVCREPLAVTYGLTIANPLTIVVFTGYVGLISSEEGTVVLLHALTILFASLIVQLMIAFIGSRLANFIKNSATLLYFNMASAIGIMLFGIVKLL